MASGFYGRRGTALTEEELLAAITPEITPTRNINGAGRSRNIMNTSPLESGASANRLLSTPDAQRDDSLNRKIDRVLKAVNEQQQEAKQIREELNGLKEGLKKRENEKPRSKRIPADLSALVKGIHEKADEQIQFDGSQLYCCERNQEAKDYLITQVTAKVDDSHSPKTIKRAVHRYYESRRRLFNDNQPNRIEAAKTTKRKAKCTFLRKQLYDRRKKCLKQRETEKWSLIDFHYMTEESCDEDDNIIRQHQLPWRSEELNRLIRKLNKRWDRRCSRNGWRFQAKERVLSTPSESQPPTGYQEWAVTLPSS